MTVDYMRGIATVGPLTFMRVLCRWRGSIWKSIIVEFSCWFLLYCSVSLFYRIVLFGTDAGVTFEALVGGLDQYLKKYGSTLNFVAAFYITYINTRWWWLFTQIPWPDNFCMLVSALMKSNGNAAREKERQIRLAICRYWNLSFVLLLRDISVVARRRYPNLESLSPSMASGEEVNLLRQADDIMSSDFQQTCLYSLPLDWIQKILKQAADDGNFLRVHLTALHEEVVRTRHKMYNLLAQDFICAIPFSLTQIAVATPIVYFTLAIVGKQQVIYDHGVHSPVVANGTVTQISDLVIPFYTIYEFIIYVGWMKAAMSMLNPFGVDDDDFEMGYLIDRNSLYMRILLDDLFELAPKPKDVIYQLLPHTAESAKNVKNFHPSVGSVAQASIERDKAQAAALMQAAAQGTMNAPPSVTARLLAAARQSLTKQPQISSLHATPAQMSPLLATPPQMSPRMSTPSQIITAVQNSTSTAALLGPDSIDKKT